MSLRGLVDAGLLKVCEDLDESDWTGGAIVRGDIPRSAHCWSGGELGEGAGGAWGGLLRLEAFSTWPLREAESEELL